MKIIGLTGGIASGKSTVSAYLKSKNIPVIDADIESKRVLDVGNDAYYDVIREFSDSILNEDKTVNRKKLAEISEEHLLAVHKARSHLIKIDVNRAHCELDFFYIHLSSSVARFRIYCTISINFRQDI